MYDLFVLGGLMSGDRHGYLLQESLKHALGPVRQISSGTLYPLISRLVESGCITLRLEEGPPEGRPRKIYGITDAGRRRFDELMAAPLPHSMDTEVIFHFKLGFFSHVPTAVQLACLEQYLAYLHYNLNYITNETRLIAAKQLPEPKRAQLLRVFDHRRHVKEADIAWVKAEIERVRAAFGAE